jgi:site-specific DNA-methyltransferase (adenine-specific)
VKPYYQDSLCTIYHGDCREVLPRFPDQSIDVLWTDPPYGHSNHDGDLNSRLNNHRAVENLPIANDSPELMREVVDFALVQAARLLKEDCCCCCCCGGGGGPRPTFAWVANRLDSLGLQFFHSVIWDKLNPGLGWRYRRQHEMVMVAHRVGGKLRWADESVAVPNIVKAFPPRERLHPNEKPLQLVTAFLAWHSQPGDTILDPFMGSGTTLRAAKDLGRHSIGIELEERYCEIAAHRLAQECLPFSTPNHQELITTEMNL